MLRKMLGWGGGDDNVPCEMNLLKPSAATVETCGCIQVQLMGCGAARKKLINSSLWTYTDAWQWRWEVCQTGDACIKATGIKLPQMAKM